MPGKRQILAGGFTGGTSLLLGPDGQEWVFDYKTAQWMQSGMSVTLTRLGDGPGQEERHTIDFRAGIWSAVWLSGLRFFLAGDGHFGLVDLDNTTTVPIDERLRSPHPDQRGAVRIDEHTVMTATRHGAVYRIDVETGKSTLMARLDMLALGCDLASGHQGRAYVLEHPGSPRSFIPMSSPCPGTCHEIYVQAARALLLAAPSPATAGRLTPSSRRHHPDPSARSWMSRHGGMSGPISPTCVFAPPQNPHNSVSAAGGTHKKPTDETALPGTRRHGC